ncbi:hypothetical protein TTHERM_00558140 (macronuclear) [Tetrahymena thermophila SB210]|uniref:Cyclic nucleotide-binding domain protein n=1 Tax=Tetrahymena thermophila (strain SB210) TaxID=312017 RepID=I7M347_TETTS|nr:hypothetical protein TTHERM_00558140 [Tetrahymena thermophila SB210]EAS02133.2 hypothetical protein TTHERM_00558140 [Tetrahymena thermophila SB210]|eukprot:XP_001022378.2 hypothetical protein TTHERM_00558140 [Tetrahymena thermophila SB210]
MLGAFGGLLGQSTEKKRQQQFIYQLKKEDKTESEIEFVSKYLESNIKSNTLEQIKSILEKEEFDKIIKLFQYADLKQGDEVPSESNQFQKLNLIFIINGSIELIQTFEEQNESLKKFETNELIVTDEQQQVQLIQSPKENATYKLVCVENSQIAYIKRSYLDKILEASSERFEKEFKTKINCLKAVFPNIAKAEQGQQRLKSKNFKLYGKQDQGTIMTTTTSGSNDVFVLSKGKILVWVPKSKVNQDYSEDFIVIGLISENQMFNESYSLFNKECIYGTMMIGEGKNEVFQINKDNLGTVCENSTLDYLKANSEIKDRMYKNHIKRYSSYKLEEILEKQKDLCKKLDLSFDKIKELFQKSTKDKKIVTHNLINKNDFNKNLENFNKIMKNSTFKTTELQGDKEDIASTVTPRLVSRGNGLKSLTPAQQLSLIALRSSGKGLREGTRNVNQKISDLDFDKAEEEKKNLNQLVNGGGILVKKNIQTLDVSSKSETKSQDNPVQQQTKEESKEAAKPLAQQDQSSVKKSLHQKLEVSNGELLQKLGQFDSTKPQQNDQPKQSQTNVESTQKNPGFIQMSEFSLKTTTKDKPFNSVFLNIAKEEINQVESKPKVEDKFAQQRKKLMTFGI